jgi:hypothetical protein
VLKRWHETRTARFKKSPGRPRKFIDADRFAVRALLEDWKMAGTAISRQKVRDSLSASLSARGADPAISATTASRILAEERFSFQKVTATPVERFRETLPAEVEHYKTNANRFAPKDYVVMDETHVSPSMVPRRSFAPVGSGGAHLLTLDNVRSVGATVVVAVRGDGTLVDWMYIPHHGVIS